MRSAIPYYILTLLDRHGSVYIPGVGHLVREVQSARIDDAAGRIDPPKAQVDFSETTHEGDGTLTAFITYRAGIVPAVSERVVRQFAGQILSGLDAEGSILIEHFGTFSRRGGRIHLNADDKAVNLRFEGLEAVPIPMATAEPVPESEEVTASPYTPAVKPEGGGAEGKRRRRVPLFIPVLIVLFLAVCIFAYLQYLSSAEQAGAAVVTDSTAYDTAEPVIPPPAADTSATQQDTGLSLVPGVPSAAPSSTDTSMTKQPAWQQDSGQLYAEPRIDTGTDMKPPPDNTPSELPKEDSVTDKPRPSAMMTPPEDTVHEEPAEPEESQPTSPDEQVDAACIVVVGAFAVHDNVVRMEARLADMGYSVVKVPTGKLTQVGVPVECGSSEARFVLGELRHSVEANAWLLKR